MGGQNELILKIVTIWNISAPAGTSRTIIMRRWPGAVNNIFLTGYN